MTWLRNNLRDITGAIVPFLLVMGVIYWFFSSVYISSYTVEKALYNLNLIQ